MGKFLEYLELSKKDNPIRNWLIENGFNAVKDRDKLGYELVIPLNCLDRLRSESEYESVEVFVNIPFKILAVKKIKREISWENTTVNELVHLDYQEVTDLEAFKKRIDSILERYMTE